MKEELQRQLTDMALGVDRFHREVVDLPVPKFPKSLSPERRAFRVKFIQEELEEFVQSGTMADDIDALIDLIYVAIGALLEMGVNPLKMFDPVQEKNMQKVRGLTKRGEEKDAIKPEGWTPPDYDKILEELTLRYAVSAPLLEATKIRLERSAKYNSAEKKLADDFPFGIVSIFQMMHVKHMRLLANLQNDIKVNRDHPIDLINYSGFMLDFMDGKL